MKFPAWRELAKEESSTYASLLRHTETVLNNLEGISLLGADPHLSSNVLTLSRETADLINLLKALSRTLDNYKWDTGVLSDDFKLVGMYKDPRNLRCSLVTCLELLHRQRDALRRMSNKGVWGYVERRLAVLGDRSA